MAAATENADELVRTLTRVMTVPDRTPSPPRSWKSLAAPRRSASRRELDHNDHHRKSGHHPGGHTRGWPRRVHRRPGHRRGVPAARAARDQPRRRVHQSSWTAPPSRSPPRWPSRSATAGCAASACSRPTVWFGGPRCATSAGASPSRSQCRSRPCLQRPRPAAGHRSGGGVDDYWEIHRNAPAFDSSNPGP